MQPNAAVFVVTFVTLIIKSGDSFSAGWSELIPLRTTTPSSDGTTHYAITECALLRIAADFLKSVHGSTILDDIGSSSGVCPDVRGDRKTIEDEAKRLRLNSNFRIMIFSTCRRNVIIDLLEATNAGSHFDDETFTEGSGLVASRLAVATGYLMRDKFFDARAAFGEAMHTLQDFYAHSNWIELGKTEPNRYIGSGSALGRYAPVNMSTCRNCTDSSCSHSNILPEIISSEWLTSGYFALYSPNKPKGKCSHGGSFDQTRKQEAATYGINKDKVDGDHGNFHFEAARVAYEATLASLREFWNQVGHEKFGKFLGFKTSSLAFVIDTTGSMGPYIELVKQMTIEIIRSTTGDDAIYLPSTYILSPFNDPEYGPVTVTKDPQVLIKFIL